MKNLFAKKFPLLILALLLAITNSGMAYAVTPHGLLPSTISFFHRPFASWVVTTQTEFEQGVLNNVDTSSSPGDVKLGITSLATTYDFSTLPTRPHDAYYCDEDSAPPPVLDQVTEATTAQYEAISASDDSRWVTPDPGGQDTVFMWFNVIIDETPASITNIDLTFEGYYDTTVDFEIWAYNYNTPAWEQVGTTQNFPTGSDSTMSRSITADFGNYIDGSGKLQWGIGDSACTRDQMRTDYVEVVVTTAGGDATYNFAGFSSADYCDEDSAPPPVLDQVTEATDAQYTAISSSDDSRWVTPDPGGGDTVFMWFNVIIEEAPASITNIDLTFEGYYDTTVDFEIWAYNYNTPAWEQVGTAQNFPTGSDSTMSRSITANFGNYIDGSGKLQWGIGDSARTSDQMRTDYVKVDITYPGYYPTGTIASDVYDTGEVDAVWELLGWDETLPSGTNITFEVRASDTPFLKDDATPAWQDASVLPTGRYQQWRATLTTTDSDETPVLHEVWVLYSW